MSSPNRPKRPQLDRSAPLRNLDGIFGARRSSVASGRNGSLNGGTPAGGDTVSRGVDVGYQVINEYMRQGEAFARAAWWQRPSGGPAESRPGPDPQRLTERMFQYASDLASTWLEYVQATLGQGPLATPRSPIPAASPQTTTDVGGFDIDREEPRSSKPAAAAKSETDHTTVPSVPAVSIEITSNRRTEITVDLKPGSAEATLSVHDLRAKDPALPRISGVKIETNPTENRVTVRIEVPDDRSPATYTGLVVDEVSNLPKGTLSVRLYE
jgi:hypothetical protein